MLACLCDCVLVKKKRLCDVSVMYWVIVYGLFVFVCVCLCVVCVCLFSVFVRLLVNYCAMVYGLLCCVVVFVFVCLCVLCVC